MTQDEIIRTAREVWGEQTILPFNELKRFAALVAAHKAEKWKAENKRDYENWKMAAEKAAECERERAWTEKDWGEAAEWIRQQEREACAKLALTAQSERMQSIREAIAAAIRARGEK